MLAMSSRRRWAVTIGVMTGMLLAALEATVVGTAMPTIVSTLGGLAHYSWVFSAYLLTSTVTVPIWGKLSDLFGRRPVYQAGIAVFLVGSAACGLSQTMMQLVFARAFQGLGAGALVPLAMTIIGDMFTLEERAKMQGLFSGVWGLSSIVGPLLGGFITDQLSWRWVFYINLPVGIAAAVIIGLALQEPPRDQRPVIDYLGATLLTASVTLLMLVLVEGGEVAAIFTTRNLILIAAAIALFVWFVRVEMRAKDPVIPLTLFRNRVVSVAIAVGFLAGIAMFGAITFVPLMAQGVLGATATQAGTFLMPLMLAWVASSIVGGRLLIKVGARPLVLVGLVLLMAGLGAMAMFNAETSHALLLTELGVIGAGLGLTMLTLLIASQHSVRREQLGITTSLNQFSRSIGGALGVALLGALMVSGLTANLRTAALQPNAPLTATEADKLAENPNALVEPSARARISPQVLTILQTSLASALRTTFLICAIVVAISFFLALMIPGGKIESAGAATGEEFVMAEMTTIDAEHEPCCD
ncbi:MAG TPA: MDR family MFS transporter [Thermoanaerobaculia bacterium]|jgi:EmrB/QacA subfamily drug resistance transporter